MQDEPPLIQELLCRAKTGDANAFQRLLEHSREFLRLLLRHRVSRPLQGRLDCSDMIQETLWRAAQHFPQFQGTSEEEWRAWLARIAEREVVHQARHHLGAAKRSVSRELPLAPVSSSNNGVAQLLPGEPQAGSPSQVLMRKERALLLADALARLPEDYRAVLVLRHLDGLPFPEVAQRLQRSVGAVRVLWCRALRRLRQELKPEVDSRV